MEFENEFGAPLNISDILLQSTDAMTLAAEFKRASPSKGPINMKADILDYCSAYTTAGAKIISILTEPRHFKGFFFILVSSIILNNLSQEVLTT